MANINIPPVAIPSVLEKSTILVIDDEPEYIEWLIDYLHTKNFKTIVAKNAADAIEKANKYQFRGYIIDLNIPMGNWQPPFKSPAPVYDKYLGLYVIKYIRTQGNKGKNVVAYSAHNNEQITSEIKTLYCEYIAKGNAKAFKLGVDEILKQPFGPTSQIKKTKIEPKPKKSGS